MFALTNRLAGTTHYLDTETGEVMPVFSFNRDRILSEMRSQPGRYVRLAPQTGAEGIHIMAEFVRTVSRPELRAQLSSAIAGERPFSRFRSILRNVEPEYRRWLQFRATLSVCSIRENLLSRGIQLELVRDQD